MPPLQSLRGAKLVLNNMFTKHLFATNVITCGTLLGVGDCIVQQLELASDKERKYDYARTGRMIVIGFTLGPFNHFWYRMLDKFLTGNSGKTVLKKIACDQAVAGPFFCSSFLIGMSLLEGESLDDAIDEWKEKFLPIYKLDWAFWPAAQLINFRFLPSHLRVLYVSTATLIWNSVLSYMKHNYHASNDDDDGNSEG